eukprot:390265-Prymnesium_polylepis.3
MNASADRPVTGLRSRSRLTKLLRLSGLSAHSTLLVLPGPCTTWFMVKAVSGRRMGGRSAR